MSTDTSIRPPDHIRRQPGQYPASTAAADDRFTARLATADFQTSTTDRFGRSSGSAIARNHSQTSASHRRHLARNARPNDEDTNDDDNDNDDGLDKSPDIKDHAHRKNTVSDTSSSSSSASDSSDSSDVDDDDDDDDDRNGTEDLYESLYQAERRTMTGEETHRLAVQNLDWSHIDSRDLFVLLSSFTVTNSSSAATSGRQSSSAPLSYHHPEKILRVSIYPSDYGAEQMALEGRRGPSVLASSSSTAAIGKDSGGAVSANANANKQTKKKKQPMHEAEPQDEGQAEFDPVLLRKYEIQKLRYYYAVVECDSAETAACLYDQCDGLEVEATGNVLDLRFVPDDVRFDRRPPRDVYSFEDFRSSFDPSRYKGLKSFVTDALQASGVELTWDQTDPRRVELISNKRLSKEREMEKDLEAYIASSTDSGNDSGSDHGSHGKLQEKEQEEEKKKMDSSRRKLSAREKYRQILAELDRKQQEPGRGNRELEITFHSGLTDVAHKIVDKVKENKIAENESVWDKYLRKRQENKKEARKARRGKQSGGGSDGAVGGTGLESDEEHSHSDIDDEMKRAAFGADFDDGPQKGQGGQTRSDRGGRRRRRGDEEEAAAMSDSDEAVEVAGRRRVRETVGRQSEADPRFAAVIEDPDFAVDPTAPQYQSKQKQKQKQKHPSLKRQHGGNGGQAEMLDVDVSGGKRRKL